jgi:hypothetical protein
VPATGGRGSRRQRRGSREPPRRPGWRVWCAAHPLAVLRLRVLLRQAVGAGETGHLVSLAQTRGDPRVLEATSGRHLWQRYGEGTAAFLQTTTAWRGEAAATIGTSDPEKVLQSCVRAICPWFRSELPRELDAELSSRRSLCAKTTMWRTGGGRPPRADKETNNCSPRRLAECALVAPMLVCTCACVRVCACFFHSFAFASRRSQRAPERTLALASASASASAMTLPG